MREQFVAEITQHIIQQLSQQDPLPLPAVFVQVLNMAANQRQIAARMDSDPDAKQFGVRRTSADPMLTPMGDYPLVACLSFSGLLDCLNNNNAMPQPQWLKQENFLYQSLLPLGGSFVQSGAPLLRFGQLGSGALGNGFAYFVNPGPNVVLAGSTIIHTENVDLALNTAGRVFFELMTRSWEGNPEPSNTPHALLGQLHYYLAVAAPFIRGSAAIAELIVDGVARALGFRIIYPDAERIRNYFSVPIRNLQGSVDPSTVTGGRQIIDHMVHGLITREAFLPVYLELTRLERN